jgi:hypothetical protein
MGRLDKTNSTTQERFIAFSVAAVVVGGLGYIVSVVVAFSAATVQHDAVRERLTAELSMEPFLLSPKVTYEALMVQIVHHPSFKGASPR